MIEFETSNSGVVLNYRADEGDNGRVSKALKDAGSVTLSRVFTFMREDVVFEPNEQDLEGDFDYRFRFAELKDGYYQVQGRIFDIPNLVLLAANGLNFSPKLFIAERNISVVSRIAKILPSDRDIVVGGARAESIPIEIYKELLGKFPTTTELNHYAAARVASVIGDYLAPMEDAKRRYETYLSKTRSILKDAPLKQPELLSRELEKYSLIRDTIGNWLQEGQMRSEADWQKMILKFVLLIFPKYVTVLQKVCVPDFYSTEGRVRKREIDIALVDACGNIDVIEVKKPFKDSLLRRGTYRDNWTPSRELAGSIMQAEKYLFHLAKWGVAGERELNEKYENVLPPGVKISITNPKAMIILGRDHYQEGAPALSREQLLDFEVIKRKYANIVDIMTYDDLLRRLDNIIKSLEVRVQ